MISLPVLFFSFLFLIGAFFINSAIFLALYILMIFFFAFAILLFLLKLEFIAICFLLIYVGAVAVIIIFATMVIRVFRAKIKDKESLPSTIVQGFNTYVAIVFFTDCLTLYEKGRVKLERNALAAEFGHNENVEQDDIFSIAKALFEENPELVISCGVVLFSGICSVISMITPKK